jgi:hypothetical protein
MATASATRIRSLGSELGKVDNEVLREREQGPSGTKSTKKMEITIESNVLSAMFFRPYQRTMGKSPKRRGLESLVSNTFIPFSEVLPSGTVIEVRYVP